MIRDGEHSIVLEYTIEFECTSLYTDSDLCSVELRVVVS